MGWEKGWLWEKKTCKSLPTMNKGLPIKAIIMYIVQCVKTFLHDVCLHEEIKSSSYVQAGKWI